MNRRQFLQLSAGVSVAALVPDAARAAPTRIVVVGGGIVGSTIAYHLVQRGAQVTLLEKSKPAAGATGNSFAWINATFSKQPRNYFELNQLGISGWRRMDHEFSGDLEIQWGGSVEWHTAGAAADELRKDVARAQQWGYPVYLVDQIEFRRLLPFVMPEAFAVASYCVREGTVDPVYTTDTIVERAKRLGVSVMYPCEVTGLVRVNNKVSAVETTKGAWNSTRWCWPRAWIPRAWQPWQKFACR